MLNLKSLLLLILFCMTSILSTGCIQELRDLLQLEESTEEEQDYNYEKGFYDHRESDGIHFHDGEDEYIWDLEPGISMLKTLSEVQEGKPEQHWYEDEEDDNWYGFSDDYMEFHIKIYDGTNYLDQTEIESLNDMSELGAGSIIYFFQKDDFMTLGNSKDDPVTISVTSSSEVSITGDIEYSITIFEGGGPFGKEKNKTITLEITDLIASNNEISESQEVSYSIIESNNEINGTITFLENDKIEIEYDGDTSEIDLNDQYGIYY